MKNLLILFLMIAFGFVAHAQIAALSNDKSDKSFSLDKMEIEFLNFEELKQFKYKLEDGNSGLENLQINRDFKFIYSIAKSPKSDNGVLSIGDMKVEISDQPNKKTLIKEINDSIDGLLEIAALGN